MRHSFVRFAFLPLLALPAGLAAQTFADFCPAGDATAEAAVVGWVTDAEGETIVPGATVAASWVEDGARQRLEAQTNLEGLYALCGLPMNADISLRARLGDRSGEAVAYSTATTLAQQDLLIMLTGDAPQVSSEIGSLSQGSAGVGQVYSSSIIRGEDLVNLPEMSVYELLRQHQLLRFSRESGLGEVILLQGVSTSLNARIEPIQLRINERREGDAVSAIRSMSIDEIRRIEILSRTEASARWGGDGFVGAISITTRAR